MNTYQEYKETGIEWIGQVPEHWEVSKLKYITKILTGNSLNEENKSKYRLKINNSFPYIATKDINLEFSSINYNNGILIPKLNNELKIAEKESTLICIEGGSAGKKLSYLNQDVCFVNKLAAIKSNKNNSNKFLYFLIKSSLFKNQFYLKLNGLIGGVSIVELKNIKTTLPPLPEQEQIANYLDKKTQKIDKLIENTQTQIKSLQDYEKSLINKVVTKGLDNSVELKDSNIEWIGKIPKHWEVKRFKYLFDFKRGLNITRANLKDNGIPCINYGEIHSKYGFEVIPSKHKLKCVDEKYLENGKSSLLKYGDFIFADTSEDIEGSGNFTYLNSKERIFAGYHTIITCLKSRDNFRFVAYLFNSDSFRNQIRQKIKGVKVYSITNLILKNNLLLLPSLQEQEQIAKYLDNKTNKLQKLIKNKGKQVNLFKELRKTIINDAVTGKIKVF